MSPIFPTMRLLQLVLPLFGALLASAPLEAQKSLPRPTAKGAGVKSAPAQPAPVIPARALPPTTGFLQGVAFDSVHGEPLAGAILQVEGTSRLGFVDSLGRFLLDSIPPGAHRVVVDHPILDTLGISLVTQPFTFAANEVTQTIITLPSGETLVGLFCAPARRALGPGALVGRVREPDSDSAAVGARVSFVWYDPDPQGLPSGLRPTRKAPRVREATVAADGTYRLCGLPERFEGKLQAQRRDGGATAEVSLAQDGGLITLRSMSVARLRTVAVQDSTGRVRPAIKGTARVTGRVLNKQGGPVANARIGLLGASAAAVTKTNGEFILDSLPAGTQALVVRQLGYRPTEVPVELSSRVAARVIVRLGAFVPELAPVEVVSRRDEGLQKVGYLDRKRSSAGGYFLSPEQIEKRHSLQFTDLMRTVPGIQVSSSNGQASLSTSRGTTGSGGCVTVYVDGASWQSLSPGDLDSFVRPEEVAAVEVYNGASIPPQFTTLGQSCSAVVVWTKTRVMSRGR